MISQEHFEVEVAESVFRWVTIVTQKVSSIAEVWQKVVVASYTLFMTGLTAERGGGGSGAVGGCAVCVCVTLAPLLTIQV